MAFSENRTISRVMLRKGIYGFAAITLCAGIALDIDATTGPEASAKTATQEKIVKGDKHKMIVDHKAKELRISATVTKDCSKPGVCDFGRRFQAFFGMKGGKMEKYFVFTTDVSRGEINKSLLDLGITSRNQISMEEVEARRGLSRNTKKEDYLQGDPIIVTVRFKRNGKTVEVAMEDLIDERINVDGHDVFKPYTPHFIYHGTGEAILFPSGCIVCPSDCNGGIITDNSIPLKHTENYYRVNWDKMPPVGSEVEMVLKSIY